MYRLNAEDFDMKTSRWTVLISILLSQLIKSEGTYVFWAANCVISVLIYIIYKALKSQFYNAVDLQLIELFLFLVAQCTDGTLDIINQVNPGVKNNGQLYICSEDTWFPLCSSGFDIDEAQAACRQLGFVDGSML